MILDGFLYTHKKNNTRKTMHIFFSKDFSGELLQEPKEIAGLMRGLLTNKKMGFITLDHKARLYPGHKKNFDWLVGRLENLIKHVPTKWW